MDELKAMRTFVRVVDGGSFANAARLMDAAPAVVTRTVANLEHHFGARLMTRTTRRLALTEVGGRYLERVRTILRDAGIGIAGLASFVADQALREHRLEQVLPDWQLFDLSIWACMPTRRHVPASTRAFMDFLLAEFGGGEVDPWIPARGKALAAPLSAQELAS